MNRFQQTEKLRRPWIAVVVTAVMLGVVALLDYVTGPALNISVAYFLPITFAAWSLGRWPAILTAVAAEVPSYRDELILLEATSEGSPLAIISAGVVRFLVYLFVAEVTYRLMRSTEENARTAVELQSVNQELRSAYSRLDEDLKAAGLLQSSILAFSPPSAVGCEIGVRVSYAGNTGGDFADAGMLDGRLYVCLADISGHGTPSALFTTLLKHLIQDAHRRGLRGSEVISSLDQALCLSLPSERFVTVFYAEIDPSTGEVEYVNAGHEEGLLYRQQTGRIELAAPTAPLLGVCGMGSEFHAGNIRLDHRDVLVLYTDGAVEAKTTSGTRLGAGVFRGMVAEYAHLGAQDMVERISTGIEVRTIPEARDDMTILAVKMT